MYQALLTRRYLTRRIMPLLSALAVCLSTAMVLTTWSVMGGFLQVLLDSGKTFVGDVYRINSNSMEPTLLEDEWVFVSYDDDPVKRFELVAVRHNGENLVKRAVGLPLEDVRIDTDGDMLIRDDRVSPHEHHISPLDRHPKPIPVFDAEVLDWDEGRLNLRSSSSFGHAF